MSGYDINFYKMSGAGNDFVVIDNRQGIIKADVQSFAKQVCDRNRSIGADGLLLLENSEKNDFAMRYFNADGSVAETVQVEYIEYICPRCLRTTMGMKTGSYRCDNHRSSAGGVVRIDMMPNTPASAEIVELFGC